MTSIKLQVAVLHCIATSDLHDIDGEVVGSGLLTYVCGEVAEKLSIFSLLQREMLIDALLRFFGT